MESKHFYKELFKGEIATKFLKEIREDIKRELSITDLSQNPSSKGQMQVRKGKEGSDKWYLHTTNLTPQKILERLKAKSKSTRVSRSKEQVRSLLSNKDRLEDLFDLRKDDLTSTFFNDSEFMHEESLLAFQFDQSQANFAEDPKDPETILEIFNDPSSLFQGIEENKALSKKFDNMVLKVKKELATEKIVDSVALPSQPQVVHAITN